MAEESVATLEAAHVSQETAPRKRGSMRRFYVAVLVGGIMLAEGLLGWWVLSNRTDAAPSSGAGSGVGQALSESKDKPADKPEGEGREIQEVEIGDFQLTNYLLNGSTMHLQIHFTATIDQEAGDQFKELQKKHKFRARQRILSILRSSSQEDLVDPSLNLIRRKIQDDLNKLYERKLIMNVYFTDAHVMPQ